MRKILFLLPPMVLALVVGMLTSCRFAASYNDGDTIAASEFEPADTSLVSKRQVKDTLNHVAQNIVDSTDIFYVGTGSTRHFLQLALQAVSQQEQMLSFPRHVGRVESYKPHPLLYVMRVLLMRPYCDLWQCVAIAECLHLQPWL